MAQSAQRPVGRSRYRAHVADHFRSCPRYPHSANLAKPRGTNTIRRPRRMCHRLRISRTSRCWKAKIHISRWCAFRSLTLVGAVPGDTLRCWNTFDRKSSNAWRVADSRGAGHRVYDRRPSWLVAGSEMATGPITRSYGTGFGCGNGRSYPCLKQHSRCISVHLVFDHVYDMRHFPLSYLCCVGETSKWKSEATCGRWSGALDSDYYPTES